jgi:hypothetical protein
VAPTHLPWICYRERARRDRGRQRLLVVSLVSTIGLFPSLVAWSQQEVPAQQQTVILVRALAYDGALKSRAGTEVAVGILSKAGHGGSEAVGTAIARAFKDIEHVKIAGLPLKIAQIRFNGIPALAAAVAAQGIDVLYVCPGLEAELPVLIELTRKMKVLSIASQHPYLIRGLTLGTFLYDRKPTVVINLGAARSEGVSFGSDLLRIARVIK